MSDTPDQGARRIIDSVTCRVVADMAPVKSASAEAGDRLINDLGYDSLHLLEMAFELEGIFTLEPITQASTLSVETVADLCDYVATEVAEGRGSLPSEADLEERLGGTADFPAA